MNKKITLILFLSEYKRQTVEAVEYSTDRGFTVTGSQTNVAPVIYAIKRLAKQNDKLARIIALTTPKAADSALQVFKDAVADESPDTVVTVVNISDNVTATELLQKTLDELLPITASDSVIIETTGGYRNAVSAITLLSRFLRYSGIKVEFSTYSDFQLKRVSDTRETDELFGLLEAVNVFAATGNAREIKRMLEQWKLDEKRGFFQAAGNFYNSLLVCRTPRIESDIQELQKTIEDLNCVEYPIENAKHLIFRELLLTIIEQKMTFLKSKNVLPDFIKWCADNWYLQQAVTFLKESLVKNNKTGLPRLPGFEFNVLRVLRNRINHASEEAVHNRQNLSIPNAVMEKVNQMLNKPNEIKGFVELILTKLN
jgi:hypothetical protein